MEPLISIRLEGHVGAYQPQDTLCCAYQIDAVESNEIGSVEASVMWLTEGKGEEDLAVHYFERRSPGDVEGGDLRQLREFRTQLPNSPLSYDGAIVKVRWCVRVRVFLNRGKEVFFEQPFRLGTVPAGAIFVPEPTPAELAAAKRREEELTRSQGLFG